MQYAKSVLSAIRPRTLFVAACPVLVTLSLLGTSPSYDVAPWRLDAVSALLIAVLVQMLANLNAVYSNFHRVFEPLKAGQQQQKKTGADNKIVINLLSQTQVKRWSFAYVALILLLVAGCHVTLDKPLRVTGATAALVSAAFYYCRYVGELGVVGLDEVVFALATGPIAMAATSFFLVGTVPWTVGFYSLALALFALSFTIVKSAKDAPFARRMDKSATSLALRLDFELSYQLFLVLAAMSYAVLFLLGILLGHIGNFVLLASITRLRDIADAFRDEQLEDLPDTMASLGAVLGLGLAASIALCGLLLY